MSNELLREAVFSIINEIKLDRGYTDAFKEFLGFLTPEQEKELERQNRRAARYSATGDPRGSNRTRKFDADKASEQGFRVAQLFIAEKPNLTREQKFNIVMYSRRAFWRHLRIYGTFEEAKASMFDALTQKLDSGEFNKVKYASTR